MSDYSKKSVKELKDIAKDKNIAGFSKMSKSDLIEVLTISQTGMSSLKNKLITEVEKKQKELIIAQENLRIAKENLDSFNNTNNSILKKIPTFIIKVNYNNNNVERVVKNIDEIKVILFETFLKPNGENIKDYTFSDIKKWMSKAKISNNKEVITIDANDFYVGNNGYHDIAYINRIS
jgi:hypothetical protein